MIGISDNLVIIWTIAWKDIQDAIKDKKILVNLLMILTVLVFLYWISSVRPFDKEIEVIFYDEGNSSLTNGTVNIDEEYSFRFLEVESKQQMERNIGLHEMGIVVPDDFEKGLESGDELILSGYIRWSKRGSVPELENTYSELFSRYFDQPVKIEIGENIIAPQPDVLSYPIHFHILLAVLLLTMNLVPQLLYEEKQTKTMEALLVSPASTGQVIAGKAITGCFYVLLTGGLFFALQWAYVTNWGLAILAFLLMMVFGVGLALLVASLMNNLVQTALLMLPLMFILLMSAYFSERPYLIASLKWILPWVPTSAMAEILKFSFSNSIPQSQLLFDIAITLVSIALVYGTVIWKVRRADR